MVHEPGVAMVSQTPITSRRIASIAAFTAGGILSGILTVASVLYLDPLNPFVGTIFGAAVAIFLSLRQRIWSAWRISTFLATSVVAYFAALWSPGLITELLRSLRILDTANVISDF